MQAITQVINGVEVVYSARSAARCVAFLAEFGVETGVETDVAAQAPDVEPP